MWCPILELTIGETPSPDSPRLMKTPRRATLSPKGAREQVQLVKYYAGHDIIAPCLASEKELKYSPPM